MYGISHTVLGMVKKENQRPLGEFSKAVSAEIKGLMATHGVTQSVFAKALGRNQGYVSERVNGLKAFDTDEIDTLAGLIGSTGQDLITTVSRRIAEDSRPSNVIVGSFGQNGISREIVEASAAHETIDDDGSDNFD